MASYSSDMLPTHIEYHSANLYYTYTMYNPVDVHRDVLNDIMSLYYLHIYWIFGLNGVVYLDDIIIWSDSLEEHEKNVTLVLEALHATHLYCLIKKEHTILM